MMGQQRLALVESCLELRSLAMYVGAHGILSTNSHSQMLLKRRGRLNLGVMSRAGHEDNTIIHANYCQLTGEMHLFP